MARIAIVGPGAVGSVMAALLHAGGLHEVVLCARQAVSALEVETLDRRIVFGPPVFTNPEAAPRADWTIVTTKTYHAEGAAAWINAIRAPAAILQNGVEHRERFSPLVGSVPLVPVVVDCAAERARPGMARQRGAARVTAPGDDLGRAFTALFQGTAVVAATGDFTSAAWRKLCLNVPGVISALLLRPAGVMRDQAIAELARAMIDEAMAVGRAEGASLADDLPETILAGYCSAPPDSINSLHADVLARRLNELDARNGAVVRIGRRHGIPTPCNHMAVALLDVLTRGREPI